MRQRGYDNTWVVIEYREFGPRVSHFGSEPDANRYARSHKARGVARAVARMTMRIGVEQADLAHTEIGGKFGLCQCRECSAPKETAAP